MKGVFFMENTSENRKNEKENTKMKHICAGIVAHV